ncbi:hypothetical protein FOZ63_026802, partial [Perkinsus olseni]
CMSVQAGVKTTREDTTWGLKCLSAVSSQTEYAERVRDGTTGTVPVLERALRESDGSSERTEPLTNRCMLAEPSSCVFVLDISSTILLTLRPWFDVFSEDDDWAPIRVAISDAYRGQERAFEAFLWPCHYQKFEFE